MIYDIGKNQWTDLNPGTNIRLPAMSQERLGGKGCLVGHFVYVFGGKTRDGESISTIERLDVNQLAAWEVLDCELAVPVDHQLYVCPLNGTEISIVIAGLSKMKIGTFDTKTRTIKEVQEYYFYGDLGDFCVNRPKSNEVLFANEEKLIKLFRAGQDSFAYSYKSLEEPKDIEVTKLDYNRKIKIHDPQLGQLDDEEKVVVDRWYTLSSEKDDSLSDKTSIKWYPLEEAKAKFFKEGDDLCKKEFATLLKHLWKTYKENKN